MIEITEKEAKELLYAIWHEQCNLRRGLPYASETTKKKVVVGLSSLSNIEQKIKNAKRSKNADIST